MAKTNKPKLDIGDKFDQFTSEAKESAKAFSEKVATPETQKKIQDARAKLDTKAESKESPIVAFRLPPKMKRDLDNFALNTGYSKTDIILAGLQKVFEANPEHLKEPKGKPEIK